jgi:putative addiction module component (TIGR02574 family)
MSELDINSLTPQERLDLIGRLWDSLDQEDVSLTPALEAELARRMKSFDTDAKSAVSWEAIEDGLRNRRG